MDHAEHVDEDGEAVEEGQRAEARLQRLGPAQHQRPHDEEQADGDDTRQHRRQEPRRH